MGARKDSRTSNSRISNRGASDRRVCLCFFSPNCRTGSYVNKIVTARRLLSQAETVADTPGNTADNPLKIQLMAGRSDKPATRWLAARHPSASHGITLRLKPLNDPVVCRRLGPIFIRFRPTESNSPAPLRRCSRFLFPPTGRAGCPSANPCHG